MALCWIDLETTGLDCSKDKILEVACIVTDDTFDEVARFHAVTDSAGRVCLSDLNTKVVEMHTKNGLLAESIAVGNNWHNTTGVVLSKLATFILDNAVVQAKDPEENIYPILAGSTVSFDRSFLPAMVTGWLHYRSLDVTSLNETAKRCWPEVHEGRPQGRKLHRAMPDIEDSIALARYYRNALKPSACVLKFKTAAGNLMIVGPYSRVDAEVHASELRAGGAQDVSVEAVR